MSYLLNGETQLLLVSQGKRTRHPFRLLTFGIVGLVVYRYWDGDLVSSSFRVSSIIPWTLTACLNIGTDILQTSNYLDSQEFNWNLMIKWKQCNVLLERQINCKFTSASRNGQIDTSHWIVDPLINQSNGAPKYLEIKLHQWLVYSSPANHNEVTPITRKKLRPICY